MSSQITISELITQTLRLYRKNFNIIFKYTSIGLLVAAAMNFLPTIGQILSQIIQIYLTIILVFLIWNIMTNRDSHPVEILQKSLTKFWPFLIISFLYILFVILGLLFLIIPGFIIMVFYFFSSYILLLENEKIIASFKKSRLIIKEVEWPLFLNILLAYLFFGLINMALMMIVFYFSFNGQFDQVPLNYAFSMQTNYLIFYIITTFISIIFTPLFIIFPLILYGNLKNRNIQA